MADYIDAKHLKDVRNDMMTCTYCGFCKSVCPVFEGIGWDPSVATGTDHPRLRAVEQRTFQPTSRWSRTSINAPPARTASAAAPRASRWSTWSSGPGGTWSPTDIMLPRHRQLVESTPGARQPLWGERSGGRATLGAKKHPRLWATSSAAPPPTAIASIAEATLSILNKLGEDFTVVDEVAAAACCSASAWTRKRSKRSWRGTSRPSPTWASRRSCSPALAATACSRRSIRSIVDVPFKVRHISEFLADKDLKLKPLDKKITYHDPCHLGRHSGVYDAPGKLLSSIPEAEFKEMQHSRETARCCGGGGGVRSAYPDLSEKIAARRVDEAAFADLLVTTCPFCVNNLRVGKERKSSPVEIMDLVELIEPLIEG